MFCHHLIEFDKVQDLGLYHQKVLIKFDKILRNVQVYFLVQVLQKRLNLFFNKFSGLQPATLVNQKLQHRSYKFCEVFNNAILTKHLRPTPPTPKSRTTRFFVCFFFENFMDPRHSHQKSDPRHPRQNFINPRHPCHPRHPRTHEPTLPTPSTLTMPPTLTTPPTLFSRLRFILQGFKKLIKGLM